MNKNTGYSEKRNNNVMRARRFFPSAPKSFKKGDIIIRHEKMSERAGLLLSGLAVMKSINDSGEENIIDLFERGDIFGGIFTPSENVNLYYIVANKDCEICFSQDIPGNRNDETGKEDFSTFFQDASKDIFSRQLLHIDILSQRSTRSKLLAYFYAMSHAQGKDFTLPLSLTDTAHFLAVDRSAMMREIKKLNDEGIICSKGQRILIIDE